MAKILSARVTNFRSIEDSEEFHFDDLTCLVGKNEAGKTALLHALYNLRPNVGVSVVKPTKDYPRRHLSKYQRLHPENEATFISTSWEMNDEQLSMLVDALGSGVVESKKFVLEKRYNENYCRWELTLNEDVALTNLIGMYDLNEVDLANANSAKSLLDLKTKLEGMADRSSEMSVMLGDITALESTNFKGIVIAKLNPTVPTFFLTSHYDRMSGEVSVEKLKLDRDADTITNADRIFLSFLELSGSSLDELDDSGEYEELKARLEAASNEISEQIFKYWTQNTSLEVEVDLRAGRDDDTPPYNKGTVARARIRNTLHRVSVPFSERSAGFVWFFSFLVEFAALKDSGDKVILLLDEPGLTLHGKAQADLLRFVEAELLPLHQVIYTTHSPFLVPVEHLETVRIVEDKTTKQNLCGTKVTSEILHTSSDTLFPLQGALGYSISQSLFVGPNVLLVEGPSDILYLQTLSAYLKEVGRRGLDEGWVVCPAGGVDKVQPFVSLFSGNRLNVAVLTDYASGDKAKIRRLRESGVLDASRISTYADHLPQDEADVEDLFGVELFAELLNQAYSLKSEHKLTDKKMGKALPKSVRAVKMAEAAMRVMPPAVAEFDHFYPSRWLLENPKFLRENAKLLEQRLDGIENMFESLNNFL